MGGSDGRIRPLYRHYYRGREVGCGSEFEGTAAVVWVCDSMDLDRTEAMREELNKTMQDYGGTTSIADSGKQAGLVLGP